MKLKLTSGLIIIIFIIGSLIVSLSNEYKADTPANNPQENSIDEPRLLSNRAFDWSSIKVISELVPGQNSNTGYSAMCRVTVEGNKVYTVWMDDNDTNGAGTDYDIFFRYFDGNKWSEIEVISEPVFGQDLNTGVSYYPELAVDNGKIYVVWEDFSNINSAGTDCEIFYRCNLTGLGWEDIQVISEPVFGQDFNSGKSEESRIIVENGSVFVVWTDSNDTDNAGALDYEIFFRCNLSGSGWGDTQVISEPVIYQNFNTGNPHDARMAVENDRVYVVWTDMNNTNGAGSGDYDIFYRCNLTGSRWEPIQVLSEPVPGQDFNTHLQSYIPDIVVENGNIYVVWLDGNNTNNAGFDWDIFYRCNLTGTHWEDEQIISEPIPGQNRNTGKSSIPNLAVENGQLFVIWHDNNNTNNAGGDNDIFYRCNRTGFDWEPVQVISEPIINKNTNFGDSLYTDIDIENSKIYVVWNDDNNTKGAGSDMDIFYRWMQVPFSPLFLRSPKVTPLQGNTSTEFNFTVSYLQLNNTIPSIIKVIIDGNEQSMLEVDQTDTNYTNGKNYYFIAKNLDIGVHTYEFNTSDGFNYTNSRLFSNLIVKNTPPQIITTDNLTAIEDEYYEVIYEFEDIDIVNIGQPCHWEFKTNANWLDFDLITGKLSGTPGNNDVGEYWVFIAVNDTIDIVFTNFTLTILDVNDLPIILTNNVESINEDELYEVDYEAADIDSVIGNQIWSLDSNATSWLNISSSSGILNGTPGNDDVGVYWINVSVNDTEGGSDFTNFTLTVLNVNDRPVIITEDVLLAETDKVYEVQYNAIDIDSQSSKQAWSLSTNATWLSIDPTTGVINGTPIRIQAGWYVVNVTVSDGDGGIDWHRFILEVVKGNLPPIIITEDLEIARINKSYEVDYNATDDRTHPNFLTWDLETNASWLSIESTSGILTGIPSPEHGGNQYWIKVTVFDHENGLDFHNFTLAVLKEPKPKNNIPSLTNYKLTPLEGDTETEFTFTVNYFDLENDLPTFIQVVIDGIAYDMNLRSGGIVYNGKYEYKTKLSEGVHSYYFTASDGSDTNISENFTTPNIEKLDKVDGDGKGTKKESFAWEWLILIIVIIVIVILMLVFLMIRRKKKEAEEIIPPTQPEVQEQVGKPPQEPAQTEIPVSYPDYYTPEPQVQDNLYYTPPEEPVTDSAIPPEAEPGFEPVEENEMLEE
jgi:hypothetical protein